MKYMVVNNKGIPTFYTDELHQHIPSNAVKISDEEWKFYWEHSGKIKWDSIKKKFVIFNPLENESIDKLRKILKLQITNKRKEMIKHGIIITGKNTANIYQITIDNTTKINIQGYISDFNEGIKNITSDKVLWKFDNDKWSELTYDALKELAIIISNFIESCFNAEAKHVKDIDNIKNYNDYKNYKIEKYWPSNIFQNTYLE